MTALSVRILVAVDDQPTRKLLHSRLRVEGYEVIDAPTGQAALGALGVKPDVMILDFGPPDMKGLDILRSVRERDNVVPVLILSNRENEARKVRAFDLGADDYVIKPFGMNELLARLRTALRHGLQRQGQKPVFTVDGLSVDLVKRTVAIDGIDTKLSPKEFELLRLLVHHAGKVVPHAFLLQEVWSPTTDPQYLRVYIRQLRQKIDCTPYLPSYIETETGVGYRLRTADQGT